MKKILMIAVMAVAAVSANAQWWIGGEIGLNTTGGSIKNKIADVTVTADKTTNVDFTIAPEIGYNINDNWAVAAKLVFKHDEYNGGITNSFNINPYVRYTFVKAGNFSVFCDGGVSYGISHDKGDNANTNNLSVGLNPGISYAISPKVGLVAHIGDLSYNTSWYKDGDYKNTDNKFNVGLWNSISFGAYYNF